MKADKLIASIHVDRANFEHIAKTGKKAKEELWGEFWEAYYSGGKRKARLEFTIHRNKQ